MNQMNQNGFSAVVKAKLHPTAEAGKSDQIKDKLYSTKINPHAQEKRSCLLKASIHPRSGRQNSFIEPE